MADIEQLKTRIEQRFQALIQTCKLERNELTIEVAPEYLRPLCLALRDESEFDFKMLVDVCGVDYLQYGIAEWETESTTATGFERGVDRNLVTTVHPNNQPRFATVYHLLSLSHNQRVRVRTYLDSENPIAESVFDIWPSANWFEREAFDLFGILFTGHPDLRRILTDYGFVGHPFRKDFPVSGNVEVHYDAKLGRVVYGPLEIEPRVLEPKVIRLDNRFETGN